MRSNTLFALVAAVLLIGAIAAPAGAAEEYRMFWVDAWGAGFLNQSQVDNLLGVPGNPTSLGVIREANCNAVIVQVRRRADVCYPSGMGEPYFSSGLSPANFNALQAMIDAAHDTTGGKKRIEVHCWLVAFATSSASSTPQTENIYWKHNIPGVSGDPYPNTVADQWTTMNNSGVETDDKALDPGHPDCLQFLNDVCMDMVNNFDIDGIHYDYIRFTANNQGYNPTSVARYNQRYGLTGQPASTDEQFKQWRRDQVTSLVRKVYANIQAAKPWVKHSASVVTWNPSPTASTRAAFQATRPYYDVYSDWDAWMQEGLLDMNVPMTYYNQASLPNDFQRWMNFQKDRRFNRFNVVGPGIYLNSLSNAILQLQKTREASAWNGGVAQGFSGYSFRAPYSGGTWADFAPSLLASVTPTWADVPQMPWKVSPTKGHIKGTITVASTGQWADHTLVTLSGPENRTQYVDGTGFYAFIDLTPGTYTITASLAGYANVQRSQTVQIGQVTGNMYTQDMAFGVNGPPVITNVAATGVSNNSATITWNTDQPSTSRVEYGLTTAYGSFTTLDSALVTSHSQTINGLAPKTTYNFRVLSSNTNGPSTSANYTFKTSGPPVLSGVQVTPGATTAQITWTTDVAADSLVRYGLTSGYGSTASGAAQVTTHTVNLTGLAVQTPYHFQLVSANIYGSAETVDAVFTTTAPSTEVVVDNLDPGWSNTSPNGNGWTAGSVAAVPKVGTDYLYIAGQGSTTPGSSTRSCRWTANLSQPGYYDIYVFYQKGTNRNTAAPYTATFFGGSVSISQNQNSTVANQGDWYLIAPNVPCLAGTGSYVELSNLTTDTKLVSADAAKWVFRSALDVTAPVMSDVIDGHYTASTTTLSASWSATDPESAITKYEYAVGTTAGGSDVKSWTDAGTNTAGSIDGLTLQPQTKYYISVRATNSGGLVSSPMSSEGVTVAQEVATIGDAKKLANGTFVKLTGKLVSAAQLSWTAVQEPARAAGIRVLGYAATDVGRKIDLYGKLSLEGNAERVLTEPRFEVQADAPAALQPLSLTARTLASGPFGSYTPGMQAGFGLSNQGLLVRVVGKVGSVTAEGFTLEDGGLSGGLRVTFASAPAEIAGTWQSVTGVASSYLSGSSILPQLLGLELEAID